MRGITFKLKSLPFFIVLISHVQIYSVKTKTGHSFIGIEMNQPHLGGNNTITTSKPLQDNRNQSFKTAIINKNELINDPKPIISTHLVNNPAQSIIPPEIKSESKQQKQQQQQQQQQQHHQYSQIKDNEADVLQKEIASIIDNIKLLGSELINASSSTKEILNEINELSNAFAKIQFEIATNGNEQHKKLGIINDRLSKHFKEQLEHQLFMINKAEDEIKLKIKADEADLSALEFEIYLNSKCSVYQSCSQCSTDSFCGWCVSANKCVEGDSDRPLFTQCQSYSYSICDQEALCFHTTCNECIANSLCSWCANSPKPYCSKATEKTNCSKDLTISLLGDNPVCPMVNYRLKYQGGYQTDFLKENTNMEKRRQLKENYNSIFKGIQMNKANLDVYEKERAVIGNQQTRISQQKEDFSIIEEDLNQSGFTDDFQKKMMNVFRTELLTFLENLKKRIASQ